MNEALRKPFMPPSREAIAAEWRRSFIRAATCNALAQIRKSPDVGGILRASWPNDSTAVRSRQ